MPKSLMEFGKSLNALRLKKEFSLRDVCAEVGYDPSNWSKIERGRMAPPSDINVIRRWAIALGLKVNSKEYDDFVDKAMIAQGIIPSDILSDKNAVDYLPAFFRTLRNKKPTKEETDKLIGLIRDI